ncbi:hypothetical protein RRG08_049130 [Elysia crispata]|uniref:Uncharacterized protein n=1 Tax=Elysia crispata TaxID=231223 RepID=A0AAE1D785_9GAST|nr:hypothetical protein RRG08_049130 [Elysia crispata]
MKRKIERRTDRKIAAPDQRGPSSRGLASCPEALGHTEIRMLCSVVCAEKA